MIKRDIRRWAAVAGWLGICAIAVLSLVPGSLRPHTPLPGPLEHMTAYALSGAAFAVARTQMRFRLSMFVGMTAAAFVFEALQILVPGRSAAVSDAIASSSGAALGLLIGAFFSYWFLQESERPV
jgi:VanZ family protein